jgi:hypothetical protein
VGNAAEYGGPEKDAADYFCDYSGLVDEGERIVEETAED